MSSNGDRTPTEVVGRGGVVGSHSVDDSPRNERPRIGRSGGTVVSRIALLLVLLLGAALVSLHIHSYRQLSIYDEVQHVDYVYRLLSGEIPASGDKWVPASVDAVTCRTIDYPAEYPACGQARGYADLPNSGFTTAFIHTPTYYLVPAATVWAADRLSSGLDQISAMRVTGVLWLSVALALMWSLWRELRVPWQVRAGVLLILVATPGVLLAHSTVTNDATGLAAGAAMMLATLGWDRKRFRLWVPVVVAVLALLLKTTSLAVLLLACAFVLIRSLQNVWPQQPGRWWKAVDRPRIAFVAALAAASAVVGVGWSALSTARASMDERLIPQNVTLLAQGFDPAWLTTSLLAMTSPLDPQFLQSALVGTIGTSVGNLVNVGLLALAVVGAVRSEPGSVVRALAVSTGAAMLAFGPLLTLINYVTLGVQFGIPARYGYSLVPAMAALAATAVRSCRGGYALIAVGLAFCAAIAWELIH